MKICWHLLFCCIFSRKYCKYKIWGMLENSPNCFGDPWVMNEAIISSQNVCCTLGHHKKGWRNVLYLRYCNRWKMWKTPYYILHLFINAWLCHNQPTYLANKPQNWLRPTTQKYVRPEVGGTVNICENIFNVIWSIRTESRYFNFLLFVWHKSCFE